MAATITATILALHITFVAFKANADNGIVRFVDGWATTLAWQFHDIFAPADERLAVLVNYGLAGIAYLVFGRIAARLIQRLG